MANQSHVDTKPCLVIHIVVWINTADFCRRFFFERKIEYMEHFFATCPRGLEPLLVQELDDLGMSELRAIAGGVRFSSDWEGCARVNLWSRLASRVLWQVAKRRYRGDVDIYKLALHTPWSEWFTLNDTIKVSVTAINSPVRSVDFVTLRIKDAVCDHFRRLTGQRPSVDTQAPSMRIVGFLDDSFATLYLDTSGEALFKRGWRVQALEAPLRENLAAGILTLMEWDLQQPLLDPMCGSGTFLLEAAAMACGRAPGLKRAFALERFRHVDQTLLPRLREQALRHEQPLAVGLLFGRDSDSAAIACARANLAAAGWEQQVSLSVTNVCEGEAPATCGMLVTNPPYGVRLGEQQELAAFYPRLATQLKRQFAGWEAFVFTADLRLPKLMGLKPSRRTPLFNGALECRLYQFTMVAGRLQKSGGTAD